MTTYTAYNINSGTILGRGLTAVEAAQEILSHDSHQYDLRHDGDTWTLYVSRGSAASFGGSRGFTPALCRGRTIRSNAATEAEAWVSIAFQVIKARWESVPVEALTDAAYDEIMAVFNGRD